jgi:hypothetical protein
LAGRMLRDFASKPLGNLDLRPVARVVGQVFRSAVTHLTRGPASVTSASQGTEYLTVGPARPPPCKPVVGVRGMTAV